MRDVAGATYVRTFEMRDGTNKPLYHLIFGTKNLKGLEVMKAAMFKVDRRGTYKFSDKTDPGQTYLIDYSDDQNWIAEAAQLVFDKFRGKTVFESEIRNYVIGETPHRYLKSILEYLEKSNPAQIIKVDGRKRAFTYPDGCKITFLK